MLHQKTYVHKQKMVAAQFSVASVPGNGAGFVSSLSNISKIEV